MRSRAVCCTTQCDKFICLYSLFFLKSQNKGKLFWKLVCNFLNFTLKLGLATIETGLLSTAHVAWGNATLHQVLEKSTELVGLGITKKEGILWEIMYFVDSRYCIQMTAVSLCSDKHDHLLVPIKNMTPFLCVTGLNTINSKYLTPWCRVLPEKLRVFQLVQKQQTYFVALVY